MSEERRHNKLLSKSRDQAKNDEFSVGQNNRDGDTSIHDAKTSSEKGNEMNSKMIKKMTMLLRWRKNMSKFSKISKII